MNAPFLPRMLLTAITASADYESVSGDLDEEYAERFDRDGSVQADLWYWSQALRSIPSLLSYSRYDVSGRRRTATALIVLAVLVAMLAGKDLVDRLIDAVNGDAAVPFWLYFGLDWAIAVIFGGVLAAFVRHHPVRVALIASTFLVVAFAAPIVLGVSSRLILPAWLMLVGTIPAMCIGAAAVQALRKR